MASLYRWTQSSHGRLAQAIVRDGEGATKFVEIQVTGATSDEDAHQVAKTVAHSPLVKTALLPVTRTGVVFWRQSTRADCKPGCVAGSDGLAMQLVSQGAVDSDYTEQAAAVFAQSDIQIRIDLGAGQAKPPWTCDFSHEYVSINADYRSYAAAGVMSGTDRCWSHSERRKRIREVFGSFPAAN